MLTCRSSGEFVKNVASWSGAQESVFSTSSSVIPCKWSEADVEKQGYLENECWARAGKFPLLRWRSGSGVSGFWVWGILDHGPSISRLEGII